MSRYHTIVLFLAFLTLTSLTSFGQDCSKDNAKAFLKGLFKERKSISTEFRDYSEELMLISTPTLNKFLPDYCFFSTSFYSTNFEYSNVETVIALSKTITAKSKIAHSPVYTDTPDDFIKIFRGIKILDTTERITLAKDIANIFTAITYKGHVGRLINLKERDIVSFELWHDDLSWRIYNFQFDSNGKLAQIKIGKGFGRGEISSNYLRFTP